MSRGRVSPAIPVGLLAVAGAMLLFGLLLGGTAAWSDSAAVESPVESPANPPPGAIALKPVAQSTPTPKPNVADVNLSISLISLTERAPSTVITVTATRKKATVTEATVTLALPATRPSFTNFAPSLTVGTDGNPLPIATFGTDYTSSDFDDEDEDVNVIIINANQLSATTTFHIDPGLDTGELTGEGDETVLITGTAEDEDLVVAPTELIIENGPHLSFPRYVYGELYYYGGTVDLTVPAATNAVGGVTYSADNGVSVSGTEPTLTFTDSNRKLEGSAGNVASVTRYTITATDDMGTTPTVDDLTATTIVNITVIEDVCTSTKTSWFHATDEPPDALVTNCNVLLAAKAALLAGGTNASVLSSWATGTNIRDWAGICFNGDTKSGTSGTHTDRFRFYSECNDKEARVTTSDVVRIVGLADVTGEVKGPVPPVLGHLKVAFVLIGFEYAATRFVGVNEDGTQYVLYQEKDNNRLTGPIPPELGLLSDTTVLSLAGLYQPTSAGNAIPKELTDIAKLQYLYLFDSNLTGSIPKELVRLNNITAPNGRRKLRSIYLNQNRLSGPIPWQLGQMTNLGSNLRLNQNRLSGPIPWQLDNLGNIPFRIHLDHNRLDGPIPWQLGNLDQFLFLHNNKLTGTIPPELFQAHKATDKRFYRLWLQNNRLRGVIPPEIVNTTNMLMTNSATSYEEADDGKPFAGERSDLYLHGNQLETPITFTLAPKSPLPAGVIIDPNNSQIINIDEGLITDPNGEVEFTASITLSDPGTLRAGDFHATKPTPTEDESAANPLRDAAGSLTIAGFNPVPFTLTAAPRTGAHTFDFKLAVNDQRRTGDRALTVRFSADSYGAPGLANTTLEIASDAQLPVISIKEDERRRRRRSTPTPEPIPTPTPEPVAAPTPTPKPTATSLPVAEAVADLGSNFVRSFHFNKDTRVWTFYDPNVPDYSAQKYFINGQTYWILVKATQVVILNGRTRTLTCVEGNCWNLIGW